MTSSIQSRLWSKGAAVEVAYSGGVFASGIVRVRLQELVELEPETRCAPAKHTAVEGALLDAYRAASISIADHWLR